MEVETVVEKPDGEFKMPKKAVKRKIAEAEKVTIWNLTVYSFCCLGICYGYRI